jgi:putative membrane protein
VPATQEEPVNTPVTEAAYSEPATRGCGLAVLQIRPARNPGTRTNRALASVHAAPPLQTTKSREETRMIDLLFKVAVNAVALLAAANVVPEFRLVFQNDKVEDWFKIAVIALVFALVNSYIKPIVKLVALPIGFLTMGLVAFVINAAMLLGTAWIVDQAKGTITIGFTLGGYPPHWSYEAIGCAVVASIVISVVSTVLSLLLVPRKVVGL